MTESRNWQAESTPACPFAGARKLRGTTLLFREVNKRS